MTEGVPWSVKGVEPDIRDDASRAARTAGMTLGQWLNGLIRDSLVDIRAEHQRQSAASPRGPHAGNWPPSAPASPPFPPQQEMASPHMPPFQQPYPYAPPHPGAYPAAPHAQAYAGPPYAQPYAPPPAYDPYAHAPPPYAHAPRGYDPVEARLNHYARMAQPAPAQDERVLSVVDAAVGAMEHSVKESERKTAAALESLVAMMEKVQQSLPASAAPPAPQPEPVPKAQQAPGRDATEALSSQLTGLMDRLATLEDSIAGRRAVQAKAADDPLTQARRIETQLGDALDALSEPTSAPIAGGVRPPPGRGGAMRPRVSVMRGGGAVAVADIAARQRALDAETTPRAALSAETQALDAIRRSIAALADQVRETKEEQARQPDTDLRSELKDLQKSVQDLAPRRIVASINESLRALAGKIEQSRHDGVRESHLAPIEKLLADMRGAIEQVREPRGLETINSAIAHLGRRVEEIGARSIDSRQIEDFQQQFADVRRMIAEAQNHSPATAVEHQIARIAEKLEVLAERPGDGRAIATVATAVEELRRQIERIDPERMLAIVDRRIAGLAGLETRFDDLADRIDAARSDGPAQEALDTLAQRIDTLAIRLDRPAAPAPTAEISDLAQRIERRMAGIDALGARIESLTSRLDRPGTPAPSADMSDLTQRIERRMAGIDALGSRIDKLAARMESAPASPGGNAQLDALTGRIGELQHTLERKVPTQPDVKGLEMILRKLADRVEAARAPASDAKALDALQTQIMALADKLDRSGPAVPGLSGLEKTIGDLCRVVGDIKVSAVSAAQDAARAVVGEGTGGLGMDPLAAEGMLLIKRDLTEMKAAQAETETRTRETMQTVSSLLERVAGRLGALETELATPRASSAPAPFVPAMTEPHPPSIAMEGTGGRPAPQLARSAPVSNPPAMPPPTRTAPPPSGPMPMSAGDPALDLPLEPGIGLTQGGLPGPGGEDGLADSTDPRSSFIAAARRAAQAAATQSSAVLSDLDRKTGGRIAAQTKGGLSLDGIKHVLAERRKPLLLGLAALIFALGGLKIATSFMFAPAPVLEPAVQLEEPKKESRLGPATTPVQQLAAAKPSATAAAPLSIAPVMEQETAPGAPDRSTVGSIDERPPATAQTTSPVVAAPLPPPTGAADKAIDVAELMKQSPYKGPERLKLAAMNGNLAAVYEVGARFADGRGVARDLKSAAKWLELAANQGYAPAQYRFGSFNREGLGMQQDAKVAFQWFMKAAEQGHILAMHNLAVLYAEGVNGSPDYGAAAAWFRNAAEHGVKDSQFNIAILHVRGLGVAQDMTEAYKWFAVAAQQGDADAIKRRDEVAARLSADQLADGKTRAEEFRPRRPDMRANDVSQPEGGWDQAPRAPGAQPQKKTRA